MSTLSVENLQHPSSSNANITLDSNGNATFAGSVVSNNSLGFRNRIINGDMRIDQRNAGAAVTINTTANIYTLDRWAAAGQLTDGVFTVDQVTDVPANAGFTNSTKVTVTTADASIGATQLYLFGQFIEGNNFADAMFGTANAKTITVSFWTRSSLTGAFGGALNNSASDRSYPFTYTINSADTWEYKTVTVAGDTTGTWLTDTGRGISLRFSLGTGSTYSGTAGSWSGSTYYSATGATSVIGTLNATWYITGVQLEVGSVATPFERRPYGMELQLCQRYCQSYTYEQGTVITIGACASTADARGPFTYIQEMRVAPSVTLPAAGSSANQVSYLKADGNYPSTFGTLAAQEISVNNFRLSQTGATSAFTVGQASWLYVNSDGTKILLSAEL